MGKIVRFYQTEDGKTPFKDFLDKNFVLFRVEQAGLQQKHLVEHIGSPSKVKGVVIL